MSASIIHAIKALGARCQEIEDRQMEILARLEVVKGVEQRLDAMHEMIAEINAVRGKRGTLKRD